MDQHLRGEVSPAFLRGILRTIGDFSFDTNLSKRNRSLAEVGQHLELCLSERFIVKIIKFTPAGSCNASSVISQGRVGLAVKSGRVGSNVPGMSKLKPLRTHSLRDRHSPPFESSSSST